MKRNFTQLISHVIKPMCGCLLYFIFFSSYNAFTQATTANWPLTTGNGNASVTGNITTGPGIAVGVTPSTQYSSLYGLNGRNWSTTQNTGKYYEFTLAPNAGYQWTMSSLAFNHYSSGSTITFGVYYSIGGGPDIQLGGNTISPTSTWGGNFSNTTALNVPNGSSLRIRIYAWSTSTSNYLDVRNMQINGAAALSMVNYYWNGSNVTNNTTGNLWDNNSSKNWTSPSAATFTTGNGIVWPIVAGTYTAHFINNASTAEMVNMPVALTVYPSNVIIGGNGYVFVPTTNHTFTSSVTLNQSLTLSPGAATLFQMSGAITGTGSFTKTGAGTVAVTASSHSYPGITTINEGELRYNPAANGAYSTSVVLNGGTLSTANIATGASVTFNGTLSLASASTITLGSAVHSINFSNSSAASWNGELININNWQGTAGLSGIAGKIFVGVGGLTPAQLLKFRFNGYTPGAKLLSTGEVVPLATFTVYSPCGENLLGAKGTFSSPFITAGTIHPNCTSGCPNLSPWPSDNMGARTPGAGLPSCASPIAGVPCTNYNYYNRCTGSTPFLDTYGMPEGWYTFIKNIGNRVGNPPVGVNNCVHSGFFGQDHTGDGGYFMALNGSQSAGTIFYEYNNLPVCPNTNYEFGAWVMNILTRNILDVEYATYVNSEPNVTFFIDGVQIGTSGPIQYQYYPTWVKVGASFNSGARTSVNIQVRNNQFVYHGNDLALDDITIRKNCTASASITAAPIVCPGMIQIFNATINDASGSFSYYKWQVSTDGGVTFTDIPGASGQGSFSGGTMTLSHTVNNVTMGMNGYIYRVVVADNSASLGDNCNNTFLVEKTLIVANHSCGGLPLQLSTFSGKLLEGSALLEWATLQEKDVDQFTLYRSYDGRNFEKVTEVKGAGNSLFSQQYRFTDSKLKPGTQTVFYRLAATDFDGQSTVSPVIRLSENRKSGFEVYPNPIQDRFTISVFSSVQQLGTIRIVSADGSVLFKQQIILPKGTSQVPVQLKGHLPAGIYIAELITHDERFYRKLVKE
jgi:autotransporter-associated beta strand protein